MNVDFRYIAKTCQLLLEVLKCLQSSDSFTVLWFESYAFGMINDDVLCKGIINCGTGKQFRLDYSALSV